MKNIILFLRVIKYKIIRIVGNFYNEVFRIWKNIRIEIIKKLGKNCINELEKNLILFKSKFLCKYFVGCV